VRGMRATRVCVQAGGVCVRLLPVQNEPVFALLSCGVAVRPPPPPNAKRHTARNVMPVQLNGSSGGKAWCVMSERKMALVGCMGEWHGHAQEV